MRAFNPLPELHVCGDITYRAPVGLLYLPPVSDLFSLRG